jgi:hypothetical protein
VAYIAGGVLAVRIIAACTLVTGGHSDVVQAAVQCVACRVGWLADREGIAARQAPAGSWGVNKASLHYNTVLHHRSTKTMLETSQQRVLVVFARCKKRVSNTCQSSSRSRTWRRRWAAPGFRRC